MTNPAGWGWRRGVGAWISVALLAAAAPLLRAPRPAAALDNPIVVENQQPGSTGWEFTTNGSGDPAKAGNHEIEGYASLTSVNKGGQISFMVSLSSSAQYTMAVYRMGYYPTGTNPDGTPCAGPCGGRLMQTIGPLSGGTQPTCPTVTTTVNFGLTECNWAASYTLTVPTTWTTGNYIVKLRRNDTGLESYMTFVLRDDAGPADIVLSMDVSTWQAYNFWGGAGNGRVGYSLYGKFDDVSLANTGSQRAYAVSFNRPYIVQGSTDGAGNFMVWDYPMVRWLESQGYNVTYATNVDMETNPNLLNGRKAFINTGHDEYYSDNMRANLQGYIDRGAHMGFFSANNVYYRIRWANSSSGQPHRRVIAYKSAALDPESPPTVQWRSLTPPKPENAIVGMLQNGVANDRAFRVYDASSWIYAGTGLVNYVSGTPVTSGSGQNAIAGIIGYEFDTRAANDPNLASYASFDPPGLQQVAHSAIPSSDNGVAAFSDATLYTASSGAIVFSSGTLQWSWGLDNGFNNGFCSCNPGYANAKSRQITANILNRFLTTVTTPAAVTLGPSSLTFPSQPVNTTSAAQVVTLTNTGGAPLSISSIGITGTNPSDFSQTNACPANPTTLAASGSCTISVTFNPTATGARAATLTVSDNANGSPHTVALTGTGAFAPAVALNPQSVTFPHEQIGTTGPPQTVTVTNVGSAPLTIASIGLTGANAGDFSESTTCALAPATVPAGGSCTVAVTFEPTASGTRVASLTITDDAPGSPHTAALTGTGTTTPVPAVGLSPTSLLFASQAVNTTSATQAVTVSNTGNAPLTIGGITFTGANPGDFTRTTTCPAGPASLAAGSTCTINVAFAPTAAGSRAATLSVADDAAGSPHTVPVTGTGAAGPGTYVTDGFESGNLASWQVLTSSGGAASVQSTYVNSGTKAARLTNTGTGHYTGLYANLAGGPHAQTYSRFCFNLSGLSGSTVLAQGRDVNGNNMWEVDYNGPAKGLDFYFWNGARTRTDRFTPPNVVLPNTWYCVEVQLDEVTAGHAQVWLNGVSMATVDTNLSAANPYSRLYLWNNGAAGTVFLDDVQAAATLNGPVGAGAAPLPTPGVALSPTSLTFASQTISTTSAAQTVTLTNNGGAPLTITGIAVTGTNAGDFARTSTCPLSPTTLAVNGSCTITVTFTPTATGARTASVSIADNGVGNPHSVALGGTGNQPPAPAVGLSPTTVSFPGQLVGTTSAGQTVTITNTGNIPLTIAGLTLAGTNPGDFAQTNTCPISPAQLAASATCTASVTFTPTVAGSRGALLSIADDAAGSPHTVAVTGTGTLPSGTYATDGFESGLSAWATVGNGSATVQSTTVNSGANAAKLTNNGTGQYIGLYADLAGGPHAQTFSRFCFNLSGLSGSTVLAQGRDVNGNNLWEVDYSAPTERLDIYFWNGARTRTDRFTPPNVVFPGLPYCAEVQLNESTSGHAQVWLNGVSMVSVDTNLSVTNAYSRMYLWNNGATGTVFVDDVQVAATLSGPVGAGAGPLPAPGVTLSPASLTFASQTVNTTSAPQTVTLTNSGGAPLTITGVNLTGANAGDFARTTTCPLAPSTLAGGGSCAVSVTFTPTATGTRSASLSITDNATGSPHTVALGGSGNQGPAPAVGLSPASVNFGGQLVSTTSAPQTVTVTNTGSLPLTISAITIGGTNPTDFSSQTTTCPIGPSTVAAGSTCTVNVAFAPTVAGTRTALLSIADNAAGSPHTVTLAGAGTLPGGAYVADGFESGIGPSWSIIGNGSATAQSSTVNSGTRAAKLTNNGAGQYVGLYSDLAGGPQVQSFSRFCFNLAGLSGSTVLAQGRDANGNNMWEVDYSAPTKRLDIYFWNGARVRTDRFTPANLIQPNTWYCAEVQLNQTASGHAEVWLNGMSVATADTDLSAANAYSRLYVWNNGATGNVFVDDVAVGPTLSGPVGAGAAPLPVPGVILSPASLAFSAQTVNTTSAAMTVTVTNNGGAPLTITGIAITGANAGDFSRTTTCPIGPSTLAAGTSCTISVTFAPTATGVRSASVSITSNGVGNPHSVALTGTGS